MPDIRTRDLYAHLLGGSGQDLHAASCVCLEGIGALRLAELLTRVEALFGTGGFTPRTVLVGRKGEEKSRARTMKWLRSSFAKDGLPVDIESLQFFPRGRTTTEDTWEPPVYFSVWLDGAQPTAFFCTNTYYDEDFLGAKLRDLAAFFTACAGYGFYFPKRFSPLGYFHGIAVEPGWREEGKYASRDSERLVHWRDNSRIGIETDGVRRFYTACDGYVRDAYPMMLLSEKHMSRSVGGSTLLERIRKDGLGDVEMVGEKYLWRIPAEKLAAAQKLLDDNDISLSGRRLDGVKEGGNDSAPVIGGDL